MHLNVICYFIELCSQMSFHISNRKVYWHRIFSLNLIWQTPNRSKMWATILMTVPCTSQRHSGTFWTRVTHQSLSSSPGASRGTAMEKASLGVGHDSKMSAIVRTKGSNPITGAIRVEGIDLSGLAVVVNIFHSHKIVSTHILINLLRTEHHSTYFKNTKY